MSLPVFLGVGSAGLGTSSASVGGPCCPVSTSSQLILYVALYLTGAVALAVEVVVVVVVVAGVVAGVVVEVVVGVGVLIGGVVKAFCSGPRCWGGLVAARRSVTRPPWERRLVRAWAAAAVCFRDTACAWGDDGQTTRTSAVWITKL